MPVAGAGSAVKSRERCPRGRLCTLVPAILRHKGGGICYSSEDGDLALARRVLQPNEGSVWYPRWQEKRARKRARRAAKRRGEISSAGDLMLLTQNLNGAHVQRTAEAGDPRDDPDGEPHGDGFDRRSEPASRLRGAMQSAREQYAVAVWQETHYSCKEMHAVRGLFKRMHGYESFGTEGKYAPGNATRRGRYTAGVLISWDPGKLICEEREVVVKHGLCAPSGLAMAPPLITMARML